MVVKAGRLNFTGSIDSFFWERDRSQIQSAKEEVSKNHGPIFEDMSTLDCCLAGNYRAAFPDGSPTEQRSQQI
jgi:hypothetical protein